MCVCVCVCVCAHARERVCVPSYSFKIVWILVCFFCGIHNDSIYHGTLYWLRCDVQWQRRISHFVDFTFGSLTALHSMWVATPTLF